MNHMIKDFKKVKNRETKKIKKLLNEEMFLGVHDERNSDAEKVDLSKDLYPLSHYLNKREEMVEVMFTIISGNSLNKILPPLLKNMNLDELKAECLIHLLGMSKKRIISILEGREIDSSSESETHSEPSPSNSNKTSVQNATSSKFVIKQDGCSDISNDSNEFDKRELSQELEIKLRHKEGEITLNRGDLGDNKMSKNKKRKSETKDLGKKKKQIKGQNSVTEDEKGSETSAESVDDNSDGEKAAGVEGIQGKTLLDILELELRAKAIRALLKQGSEEPSNLKDSQGQDDSEESVSNKKPKFKIERNYRKHTSTPDVSGKDEGLGLVTIDLTNDGESSKMKDQCKTIEKEKFKPQDSKCENTSIDKIKSNDNSVEVSNEIDNKDTEESKLLDVNSSTESIHKADPKSSWAERWLQSKDVNKVVSTSKMCANIRKRMRNARLAKQNSNSNQSSSKVEEDLKKVEGSVTEYQLLTKSQNSLEDKSLDETSTVIQDSENYNIQDTIEKTEITNSKQYTTTDISQDAPPTDYTVSSKTAEDQLLTGVSCDEK